MTRFVALVLAFGLCLSGCGVKGDPETPAARAVEQAGTRALA